TNVANYMLASITGRLSDRFGPRVVVGAGAFVMGVGLVSTAFIDQMWMGYLTYGLGVGIGAACAYVPTLALVGGWFTKRRNTALGIAAAGTGCGTLVVPPLAAALIGHHGWRVTYIYFGIAAAILLGACAIVADRPVLAPAPGVKRSLRHVVFSTEFVLLYASWLLASTALLVPFVFLPSFARDRGATAVEAALLLSVIGGVSVVGRLGIGMLGDRVEVVNLFKAAVFVMAISYVIWLGFPSYELLVLFATVLGLSYGARISLLPGVLIEFFGVEDLASTLGAFFTSSGVSAVLGPLLAAVIVDATGGYRWGIAFALGMGVLGFAAITPLRQRCEGKSHLGREVVEPGD
ncbi:MAG: MFS transporter, partial [Acidimicrobiales bacterium]